MTNNKPQFAPKYVIEEFERYFAKQVRNGVYTEDDKPDAWVFWRKEQDRKSQNWDNPYRQK